MVNRASNEEIQIYDRTTSLSNYPVTSNNINLAVSLPIERSKGKFIIAMSKTQELSLPRLSLIGN